MNNKITGEEPYFPTLWDSKHNASWINEGGVTIRTQIAAMAMEGLISGKWACPDTVNTSYEHISEASVKYADALIGALNETPNPNLPTP